MKDEGIVQPVPKGMELLSPRLHQLATLPGEIRGGICYPADVYLCSRQGHRIQTLKPSVAAYIAGLVDSEGTVTLSRLRKEGNRRVVLTIANTDLEFLKQPLPYLQSYKRQRAAFALEHYEALTPRNGKYTTVGLKQRHLFEETLLAMTAKSTVSAGTHPACAIP